MTTWRQPIPFDVRLDVLQRAAGCCEDCGEPLPLELHHTTYDLYAVTNYHRHVGELIFGRETPDVLLALCRKCHLARHIAINGEFFADPEEKEALDAAWEDEVGYK